MTTTSARIDAIEAKLDALLAAMQASQPATQASPAPEPEAPAKAAPKKARKSAPEGPRCVALKASGKRCRQHGTDKVGDDGLCQFHRDAAKRYNVPRVDDVVVASTVPAAPKASGKARIAKAHTGPTCKGTRTNGQPCQSTVGIVDGYCRQHAAQAVAPKGRKANTKRVTVPLGTVVDRNDTLVEAALNSRHAVALRASEV